MIRSVVIVLVLTMIACSEPAGDPALSAAEQGLNNCGGCGLNGLRQAAYDSVFAQMDKNALGQVGAWDGDGPVSLCDGDAAVPTGCTTACNLRPSWRTWLYQPHDGAWLHDEMLTAVVELIAPKGSCVVDAAGRVYHGMFAISPAARLHSWTFADQERVSAGLVGILDKVKDVPICLQTEDDPKACAGSGAQFHESTLFGNVFQGKNRFIAIAGGAAARNPYLNRRYGTVLPSSATVFQYGENPCVYAGSDEGLYAQYCDGGGQRWHHPVVVLTGGAPHTWYYDVDSVPERRPASF
jgi:hypothetical protein